MKIFHVHIDCYYKRQALAVLFISEQCLFIHIEASFGF